MPSEDQVVLHFCHPRETHHLHYSAQPTDNLRWQQDKKVEIQPAEASALAFLWKWEKNE